jgi:hypothetical protein
MSLASDIKIALESNDDLMDILTGGVHCDVEELSRQNTPGAFDSNGEIQPSALVKLGVEIPTGPFVRAAQCPVIIYFYDRQGFANIDAAMGLVFDQLNETQTGDRVWNLAFSNSVYNQRDVALDCALSTLRFVAIRHK